MNLTFCYTTFNGLELLSRSLINILSSVDNIVICHQKVSNKGNEFDAPEFNAKILLRLAQIHKVHIIYFEPDLNKSTKQNERDKHNKMIAYARSIKSTHFIMGACDHFYEKEQIEFAKKYVIENDIDVSLTPMYTYYKNSGLRLHPIEDYYMPFICKITNETKIENGKYPYKVDPSVMVFPFKSIHLFDIKECVLHHYSMVRVDILNKFTNAAASIRWTPDEVLKFIDEFENAKLGDEIKYFQGRKLVKAPLIFGDF